LENNFSKVAKTEGFLNLDSEVLLQVLSSEELFVTKEENVFKAILYWGEAEVENVSDSQNSNMSPHNNNIYNHNHLHQLVVSPDHQPDHHHHHHHNNNVTEVKVERDEGDDDGYHDSDRAEAVKYLLRFVRYVALSREFLEKSVKIHSVFQQDTFLAGKVNAALKFMEDSVSTQPQSPHHPSTSLSDSKNSTNPSHSVAVVDDHLTFSQEINQYQVNLRKGHGWVDLIFSHPNDDNGLIYWIGSRGRTVRFMNPHKIGLVKVTCSSPVSK
jgi:hypothetical protein